MKIRSGFVSNSSSSSFLLFKDYLTKEQIEQIRNREKYAFSQEYFEKAKEWYKRTYPDRELPDFLKRDKPEIGEWDYAWNAEDDWNVGETNNVFDFSTSMDNYDMPQFLSIIGIEIEKCGLWLEYSGSYSYTLGLNDAKTDLANYATDDHFLDDYDEKYRYTSKRYREKDYPLFMELYEKSAKDRGDKPPREPITPKKWICEDAGKALREAEHEIRQLAIENRCYFLEKDSEGKYRDAQSKAFAEVLNAVKKVEDNWKAVDDFEEKT